MALRACNCALLVLVPSRGDGSHRSLVGDFAIAAERPECFRDLL
jgi:hypothetical protein